MGLIKHLLFWPVTGPRFLIDFAVGQVEGVVKENLTDDTEVKSDLLELQLMLELGDIDDDEFVAREAAIMYRLREIREWREKFGMGVSGGPVRVSAPDPEDLEEMPVEEQKAPQVASPTEATIDLNLDWD
ncbi:MAG TPA: gas vesicle protein GvpG [Longimicrobiales bacterium]|nr:gas vesicle protein GvpG [Longimicrobiales bacterium]